MTKQNYGLGALHGIREVMQVRIVSKEISGLIGKESLELREIETDLKQVLPQKVRKLNELCMTLKRSGET